MRGWDGMGGGPSREESAKEHTFLDGPPSSCNHSATPTNPALMQAVLPCELLCAYRHQSRAMKCALDPPEAPKKEEMQTDPSSRAGILCSFLAPQLD